MAVVLYVNFTTKEVSYVGPSSTLPIIGPILSIIDGITYVTAHLSIKEIHGLRKPVYQQLQLPHPKDFPDVKTVLFS